MKKNRSILLSAIVVSLGLFPALLSAHLKVIRSVPAANAALDSSPTRLQIWFNQEPLLPMSAVALTGPAGATYTAQVSSLDIFPAMILTGLIAVAVTGGAMTKALEWVELRAMPWRRA